MITFPYFLIPRLSPQLYTFLDIKDSTEVPKPVISESLSYYLNDIKQQIDIYESQWEVYKKYTNTYEFIHTMIPYKKYCISKYRPLSRAYFKMIELIHFFGLNTDKKNPINTFHLAEGPGGFIEAIVKYRNNPKDHYIGMTLLDVNNNDYNIPAWKKSQNFLKENPTVTIETGYDKTGNILSLDNLVYVNKMYGGTMDLITGDGGFDFSKDFDNQEINMSKLLFGQIAFAICMQRQGGCFVLKVFDIFMQHTIDMIALLSSLYEHVYITKPNTSRSANSEKYIVCKGFLLNSSYKIFPFLFKTFRRMLEIPDKKYITRILAFSSPLHYYFLNRLEECNVVLGQNQIENIYLTLSYIMNDIDTQNNENETYPPLVTNSIWNNNYKKNQNKYNFKNTKEENEIQENYMNDECNDIIENNISDKKNESRARNDSITGNDSLSYKYTKTRIYYLTKTNIQKCIKWCIQHNILYNY